MRQTTKNARINIVNFNWFWKRHFFKGYYFKGSLIPFSTNMASQIYTPSYHIMGSPVHMVYTSMESPVQFLVMMIPLLQANIPDYNQYIQYNFNFFFNIRSTNYKITSICKIIKHLQSKACVLLGNH